MFPIIIETNSLMINVKYVFFLLLYKEGNEKMWSQLVSYMSFCERSLFSIVLSSLKKWMVIDDRNELNMEKRY